MNWSLSGLMQWATNEWSDPNWPRNLFFWTILGGAAWLLMRSRTGQPRRR